MEYIIKLEPKEQFDFKGVSLGLSEKLAVFYSTQIGRSRYYRNSLENPQNGLKILSFKKKINAEKVAKEMKEVYNDIWEVELLN